MPTPRRQASRRAPRRVPRATWCLPPRAIRAASRLRRWRRAPVIRSAAFDCAPARARLPWAGLAAVGAPPPARPLWRALPCGSSARARARLATPAWPLRRAARPARARVAMHRPGLSQARRQLPAGVPRRPRWPPFAQLAPARVAVRWAPGCLRLRRQLLLAPSAPAPGVARLVHASPRRGRSSVTHLPVLTVARTPAGRGRARCRESPSRVASRSGPPRPFPVCMWWVALAAGVAATPRLPRPLHAVPAPAARALRGALAPARRCHQAMTRGPLARSGGARSTRARLRRRALRGPRRVLRRRRSRGGVAGGCRTGRRSAGRPRQRAPSRSLPTRVRTVSPRSPLRGWSYRSRPLGAASGSPCRRCAGNAHRATPTPIVPARRRAIGALFTS